MSSGGIWDRDSPLEGMNGSLVRMADVRRWLWDHIELDKLTVGRYMDIAGKERHFCRALLFSRTNLWEPIPELEKRAVHSIYLVFAEWGEYSDHGDMCESVHATYEGAVAAIRSNYSTAIECLPGMPHSYDGADETEYGLGDALASDEVLVFRHPTEHNGLWWVDGDRGWNPVTWHIEEKEIGE